jgi:hypothetical protein
LFELNLTCSTSNNKMKQQLFKASIKIKIGASKSTN